MKMKSILFFVLSIFFCHLVQAGVEYNEESVCTCQNADGTSYRCLCQPTQQQGRLTQWTQGHSKYQSFHQGYQQSYKFTNYGYDWNNNNNNDQNRIENYLYRNQNYRKYYQDK